MALLRLRHRQGRELTRRHPVADEPTPGRPPRRAAYSAWGDGAFRREAERQGVSEGELFSRRRFHLAYSADELEVLLEWRTPSGKPLSWSVVRWLVRVGDRRRRAALEEQAAGKGWTVAELRAEITARCGRARAGGRKVRAPGSLKAGLVVIAAEAERLSKLLDAIAIDEDSVVARRRARATPAGRKVSPLAKAAEEALQTLEGKVTEAVVAIAGLRCP